MMIQPNRTISFGSFGYIPSGRILRDAYRRLTGFPNLGKRLQAPDVIRALDVQPGDRVLDLGCGSGYFTIELAKIAREAVGVDIQPRLVANLIPISLEGRLRYIMGDGRTLAVPDGYFDAALCSEVLMMIPDPAEFLREVFRVLRPGARLVAVNGLGHPTIERAYRKKHWLLMLARTLYGERVPSSYGEYVKSLQQYFATAFEFRPDSYYTDLLRHHGFSILEERRSPRALIGAFLSWEQFFLFVRTGRASTQKFFLPKYWLLRIVSLFARGDYAGGQIIIAERER